MFSTITIDGTDWNLPCKIKREAELKASEISGMMMDKSYFNDVIGTYMKYTVNLVVPVGRENAYAALYEILADPVDGHTFVLPYSQTTVTITGRIEVISDELWREEGGVKTWRKTTFTIIANHPTKTYTLGEAIQRGLTPLPQVIDVEDGTIYQYSSETGWHEITEPYPDADEVAY